ncbi:MAG: hypothetical protein JXA90_03985, partial [Planctomycetes bacterium]|nr:hypothetical protein [Planctomycetota bacterium]
MQRSPYLPLVLAAALVSTVALRVPAAPPPLEEEAARGEPAMSIAIGGTGGAYFLVSPGELTIDLQKRDRNLTGRRTHLRAILVGPDREVLEDVTIPDDGRPRGSGPGPVQEVRLSARAARRGVYGLNITVSQDRYGEDILWGFRTSCPRYVIETARGHRDERHQEPIVLAQPERSADVCFLPRRGALRIDLSGLPESAEAPAVYDARGDLIARLTVTGDGRASHVFPGDPERGADRGALPWRLHLPAALATIHIDGVTRWDRGELAENLCYWSPSVSTFFPYLDYRWLITPYQHTVHVRPGERADVRFDVHNHAERARSFRPSIELPDGRSWPVRIPAERIELSPRASSSITLQYDVP